MSVLVNINLSNRTSSSSMPPEKAHAFDVTVSGLHADANFALRTNYNVLEGADSSGAIFGLTLELDDELN